MRSFIKPYLLKCSVTNLGLDIKINVVIWRFKNFAFIDNFAKHRNPFSEDNNTDANRCICNIHVCCWSLY